MVVHLGPVLEGGIAVGTRLVLSFRWANGLEDGSGGRQPSRDMSHGESKDTGTPEIQGLVGVVRWVRNEASNLLGRKLRTM